MTSKYTFDQHSYIPARGIKDIPGFEEKVNSLINEHNKGASRSLTKNERTFLSLMSLYEYEPLNKLFERMGNISPATQQKIIKKLVKLKLIEAVQIRTGKSPQRLGQLTRAGWDFLNDTSKFKPLRGGPIHTQVCRSKQALDIKRGCDESICECPYPNSTGFCDVGTWIDGKLHCTEAVIGCDSNVCHHVRSCFIDSNQVESLTIVTLLKSEHKRLLAKIMAEPDLAFFSSRIHFTTLDEILKELYEK
jgi:hypothetical protein